MPTAKPRFARLDSDEEDVFVQKRIQDKEATSGEQSDSDSSSDDDDCSSEESSSNSPSTSSSVAGGGKSSSSSARPSTDSQNAGTTTSQRSSEEVAPGAVVEHDGDGNKNVSPASQNDDSLIAGSSTARDDADAEADLVDKRADRLEEALRKSLGMSSVVLDACLKEVDADPEAKEMLSSDLLSQAEATGTILRQAEELKKLVAKRAVGAANAEELEEELEMQLARSAAVLEELSMFGHGVEDLEAAAREARARIEQLVENGGDAPEEVFEQHHDAAAGSDTAITRPEVETTDEEPACPHSAPENTTNDTTTDEGRGACAIKKEQSAEAASVADGELRAAAADEQVEIAETSSREVAADDKNDQELLLKVQTVTFISYFVKKHVRALRSSRINRAATRVQAWWRGECVRYNLWRVEHNKRSMAATRIQSAWRGKACRGDCAMMRFAFDEAAKTVQRMRRGVVSRRDTAKLRAERDAAIKMKAEKEQEVAAAAQLVVEKQTAASVEIQRIFRGKKARKQLKDVRKSATEIQAFVRGFLLRRERAHVAAQRAAASTRLQAVYRGYKSRSATLMQRETRGEAAQTIQRKYRARAEFRKEQQVRCEASTKIQCGARRLLAKNLRNRMQNDKEKQRRDALESAAATRVQSAARRLFAIKLRLRKHTEQQEQQRVALKFQAKFRMWKARCAFTQTKTCAVAIQSLFRKKQAQREVRPLVAKRAELVRVVDAAVVPESLGLAPADLVELLEDCAAAGTSGDYVKLGREVLARWEEREQLSFNLQEQTSIITGASRFELDRTEAALAKLSLLLESAATFNEGTKRPSYGQIPDLGEMQAFCASARRTHAAGQALESVLVSQLGSAFVTAYRLATASHDESPKKAGVEQELQTTQDLDEDGEEQQLRHREATACACLGEKIQKKLADSLEVDAIRESSPIFQLGDVTEFDAGVSAVREAAGCADTEAAAAAEAHSMTLHFAILLLKEWSASEPCEMLRTTSLEEPFELDFEAVAHAVEQGSKLIECLRPLVTEKRKSIVAKLWNSLSPRKPSGTKAKDMGVDADHRRTTPLNAVTGKDQLRHALEDLETEIAEDFEKKTARERLRSEAIAEIEQYSGRPCSNADSMIVAAPKIKINTSQLFAFEAAVESHADNLKVATSEQDRALLEHSETLLANLRHVNAVEEHLQHLYVNKKKQIAELVIEFRRHCPRISVSSDEPMLQLALPDIRNTAPTLLSSTAATPSATDQHKKPCPYLERHADPELFREIQATVEEHEIREIERKRAEAQRKWEDNYIVFEQDVAPLVAARKQKGNRRRVTMALDVDDIKKETDLALASGSSSRGMVAVCSKPKSCLRLRMAYRRKCLTLQKRVAKTTQRLARLKKLAKQVTLKTVEKVRQVLALAKEIAFVVLVLWFAYQQLIKPAGYELPWDFALICFDIL
eukprot:g124.t1